MKHLCSESNCDEAEKSSGDRRIPRASAVGVVNVGGYYTYQGQLVRAESQNGTMATVSRFGERQVVAVAELVKTKGRR